MQNIGGEDICENFKLEGRSGDGTVTLRWSFGGDCEEGR
jgi:hypothetical protein